MKFYNKNAPSNYEKLNSDRFSVAIKVFSYIILIMIVPLSIFGGI
jgi:hypothetical protein